MDDADRELKAKHRRMWSLGDYPTLAREVIAPFGPRLVEACGITAGQRVLDVAAGAGNVAVAAAAAGAVVVASDLTPEMLDAGRREAAARGVTLAWREADAEALPFDDGEFDVVVSSVGAMFAPHHQKVADELVRVCRPGGTIGMINWPPDGMVGDLFRVMAPYAPPPPPDAEPPLLWGDEQHLHQLFAGRVASLDVTREMFVVDRFADPVAYREYFKANYGPTVATYANLAGDPDRTAALDEQFLELLDKWNRGGPDGPAMFPYDYVLVVARTRS